MASTHLYHPLSISDGNHDGGDDVSAAVVLFPDNKQSQLSSQSLQLAFNGHDEVATEAAAATLIATRRRQGHLCCGYCCDMRRAVIIVNIARACWTALALLLILLSGVLFRDVASASAANNGNSRGNGYQSESAMNGQRQINDDQDNFDDFMKQILSMGSSIAIVVLLGAVLLLCTMLAGIVGALRYNVYLLIVSALPLCLTLVMGVYTLDVINVVTSATCLYPHVVMIHEVRNGILTRATYDAERYSCCCV